MTETYSDKLDEFLRGLDSPTAADLLLEKLRLLVLGDRKTEPASAETVKRFYEVYTERHEFREGQLVKWKPGLKDRTFPAEGEPAVVVRLLEQPVFDNMQNSGLPNFFEPYDIVLGLVGSDGTFITFHFNRQKFEPYE
jgi:hypothetical protein